MSHLMVNNHVTVIGLIILTRHDDIVNPAERGYVHLDHIYVYVVL